MMNTINLHVHTHAHVNTYTAGSSSKSGPPSSTDLLGSSSGPPSSAGEEGRQIYDDVMHIHRATGNTPESQFPIDPNYIQVSYVWQRVSL